MYYYSSVKEALSDFGCLALLNGKSINIAERNLNGREKIIAAVTAVNEKDAGVFVVTTERALFCASTLGDTKLTEINILDIKSISTSKISTKLEIITNHLTLSHKGVKINQIEKVKLTIEAAKKQLEISTNKPIPQTNHSVDAKALTELKSLFDSGIITEEEFMLKKRQILGL